MTGIATPRTSWTQRLATALLAATLGLAALPSLAQEMVSIGRPVVNMRSGPGTQHPVQWQLKKGFPLQVIERQGRWAKVRDFENDDGWIIRSALSGKAHRIVSTHKARLRAGPSTRQKVLAQLPYGEVVRTGRTRGEWVQVTRPNGQKGWVAARLTWGW